MSNGKTFLMAIERPETEESLFLMCGQGFTVLRTDVAGRDIYGFLHCGREYLLMPLGFSYVGEDALRMIAPASYEEWLWDMLIDGARIQLFSPYGEHLFTDSPEPFSTCSGILKRSGEGEYLISLDKDISHISFPRQEPLPYIRSQDAGEDACSCGHHHHHGGEDHHATHNNTPLAKHLEYTKDAALAQAICTRVEELNSLLDRATAVGLECELSSCGRHVAVARIVRPL